MITKPTIYVQSFVASELESFLEDAKSNPSIMLWEELTFERDYSRQRVSEWKKKFARDPQISDLIKRIDDILKTRLIKCGMLAKNPAMAIFVLKNHHDMSDKVISSSEIVHTIKKARIEIVNAESMKIARSESEVTDV